MGKKIVAFTAGTRGGNTEVFVKTALVAASKMGIDCELIRLNECDLRPCRSCKRAICFEKGAAGCIIKDDGVWLAEKFLESDGYIIGAPVWSLASSGVVSIFRDRIFGPKMDLASWEMNGIPEWAHGRKVQRPGGLISVGGALEENWTSLGVATLYTTTFSAQTNVVDQLNIHGIAYEGEALMSTYWMRRAECLGQNVGHAVLNPQIDWSTRYLGEKADEACPSCHLSLMIAKPGHNFIECAVCGCKGNLSLKDGKIMYSWEERRDDRLTMLGKYTHIREINWHLDEHLMKLKAMPEIKEELEKYIKMEEFTVTPPR